MRHEPLSDPAERICDGGAGLVKGDVTDWTLTTAPVQTLTREGIKMTNPTVTAAG